MTNKKRLYEALTSYKKSNKALFHTPGHKSNCDFLHNLFELDFTELDETDSLFEATNVILNSEKNAARLFNAQKTLFSAGGCTLCIQAMLKLIAKPGGKVICSSIVHKSAINAMALLNLEPIFVAQSQNAETGFFKPVEPAAIADALAAHSDVCAVYVTSPDYFGVIADVKKIAEVCKIHSVPLLIDNAHGSHLGLLPEKLHPILLGADICTDSLHKTLPVFTGGALLHVNNPKFVDSAKSAMALFGSTSPSYPIMASIDLCMDWLEKFAAAEYLKLLEKLVTIKQIIKEKGILAPCDTCDPTRLRLNVKSVGLTGYKFTEHLRKRRVEPEFYTEDFVVLIVTPFNKDDDLNQLKGALLSLKPRAPMPLSNNYSDNAIKSKNRTEKKWPTTFLTGAKKNKSPSHQAKVTKISLHEALLGESEVINVENAENKICAETISQCPPGISILIPGELISKNHVKFLLKCGILFVKVIK